MRFKPTQRILRTLFNKHHFYHKILICVFARTYFENKNKDCKIQIFNNRSFSSQLSGGFLCANGHNHLWYNVDMKENKPITILLYEDDLPKLCEIRCINCSRMLCKVNAHVKSISFGDGYDPESQREMVSGMNVVEQKCRGCDCIYKFLFQK